MDQFRMLITALTHTLYGGMCRAARRPPSCELAAVHHGDRGAVSLEQVLWFVAAGVSVVVISAIVWGKIKGEANKPINAPQAP